MVHRHNICAMELVEGARTHDPEITNHVLCQLSYTSRDFDSFSNSLLSMTTNLYPVFFASWRYQPRMPGSFRPPCWSHSCYSF